MMQVENITANDAAWRPMYKPVCRCGECGAEIYAGDYFFDFDGDIACENCEPEYVKEHYRRCIE